MTHEPGLLAALISGFQSHVKRLGSDAVLLGVFLHDGKVLRWDIPGHVVEMRVVPAQELEDALARKAEHLTKAAAHDFEAKPFLWLE